MKNLRLSILAAFMMGSMLYATNSQAQSNPCGWTLLSQVNDPTCDKLCTGSIIVTPSIVLPNVVYSWSNGSASSQQYGLCAGAYTVTVTDDKKCSLTYTYNLADPAPVIASCVTLTNESYCGAGDGSINATAQGGDGNYTYEWQTAPVQTGALLSGLGAGSYTVIVYDGNDCTSSTSCDITCKKKEDCTGFRTQTQGGWGQCQQNGNNPGSYLAANFDAAFPNDLILGCTRKLKLTTAAAVCAFLPSGTSPKVLPAGTLVDPGSAYTNVFAGQLSTAMLNVGFDLYDANFGASAIHLGDLIIAKGPFTGWTVNQLIAESNKKIGGCTSSYSPASLSASLDSINNNFDNGTVDKGFLVCPDKKDGRVTTEKFEQMAVSIYPNPVNGTASISIIAANDDMLQIELYNLAGQKTASLFKGEVKAMETTTISLDGTSMDSGIYFIKVISSEKVFTQKFIVKN